MTQDSRKEAVAMRYRPDLDNAPRMVAKGKGSMAEQILTVAEENGIPLYEDTDLVRLLAALDIDAEIPSTMYQALAEVLAHIYRVNNDLAKH